MNRRTLLSLLGFGGIGVIVKPPPAAGRPEGQPFISHDQGFMVYGVKDGKTIHVLGEGTFNQGTVREALRKLW